MTQANTWEGRWFATWWCTTCSKRITKAEYTTSNGVCPACGHITTDSSLCAATVRAGRIVIRHGRSLMEVRGAKTGRKIESDSAESSYHPLMSCDRDPQDDGMLKAKDFGGA